ncbi:response regulator [Alsobacter sp. KACC 23698]|uniref:Response regulator n=1 Tax=Alsobacter sp. KACC 23698 TaxID=3149229 RepID=A0AAU7JCV9_9HYPH
MIALSNAKSPAHAPARDLPAGFGSGVPRVLVVEDDALLRAYACEVLADEGYAVAEACDACEAFRALVAGGVDLLVTDIDLGPGPDGLELARYAALAHPGLPVLYTSGRAQVDPDDRVAGSRLLPKPFRPSALAQSAADLLKAGRIAAVQRFA